MLKQAVGGALVVSLFSAACASPATPKHPGAPQPDAAASNPVVSAEVSDAGWYDVWRRTVSTPSRAVVFPVAMAPGGSALLVRSKPRGEAIPKQTLHYRNRQGEQVRIPRHGAAEERQIVSGTLRGRFAVWKETESLDAVTDKWSIYSYNIKSKRVRHLAAQSSTAPDGEAYAAPGGTIPTLGRGSRVFFSAVDYSGEDQGVVQAFTADARRASSMTVVEPGLAAQIRGRFVFMVKENARSFRVVRIDLDSRKRRTLYRSATYPACKQVAGMQGNGHGRVAVQLQCGSRVRLGLVKGGRLSSSSRVDGARAGYLALTNHYLWYASSTSGGRYKQHLNVLGTRGYRRVGSGSVSGECVCVGRLFSWAKFDGDKAIRSYARLRAR